MRRLFSSAAFVALFVAGFTSPAEAFDRWTNLDGTRTVEAEFIGLWGNSVVLAMTDGRRVTVDIDDLIAESRILARRRAEEKATARRSMQSQVIAEAEQASAPAPNPLPTPLPAPAYKPAPVDQNVLATLDWAVAQARNGHVLRTIFDLHSFDQQADLERISRKALGKANVKGLEQVIRPFYSIGDLIVTRQRWIFSHPKLRGFEEEELEDLKKSFLLVGGLIREALSEDTLQLSSMAEMPLRDWVAHVDDRLAPYLVALFNEGEATGSFAFGDFEVVDEKEGVATVRLVSSMGGVDLGSPIQLRETNGQWKFVNEDWDANIAQTDSQLDAIPDGQFMSGMTSLTFTMLIAPQIQPGFAAKSAEEFHAYMDGLLAKVSPMVAQMIPATPPPGAGMGGDMSMGMGGDMDMGMGMGFDGDVGIGAGGGMGGEEMRLGRGSLGGSSGGSGSSGPPSGMQRGSLGGGSGGGMQRGGLGGGPPGGMQRG
ncbi:MAG: hypothetical protein AAGJ83_13175, partial [Planctomycetota bacterium]